MATITVDVSEALKKLDPKDMEKALIEGVGAASSLVMAETKRYPPPPPASTYQRTGALGRSWQKKVEPYTSGVRGIVDSQGVPYAVYVMGAPGQAWMHKGRWATVGDIAKREAQNVRRVIIKALERWAR